MASRSNIYIDQGADFRVTIELFDQNDGDLPIDTYNFYADMKKFYSSTKVADFTIQKDDNDITLLLTANTTGDLKPGKYEYDVLMKKPTGEISKIVEGLAIVIPTITEVS